MRSKIEKEKFRHKFWVEFCNLLNVIFVTLPFVACWYWYYAERLIAPFFEKGNWAVLSIFLILYFLFGQTYSAFKINIPHRSEIIYSQFLAILFSNIIIFFVILLLMKRVPPILPLLLSMLAEVCISFMWVVIVHKLYFKKMDPYKTVIIWDMRQGLDELVQSYGLDVRFNIIRTVHVDECVGDIQAALDSAEVIFLCGIHSHERNQIVKYCIYNNIRAYVIPRIGDVIMSGATSMHMFHLPILALERFNPSPFYLFFKRLFDIVVSGIAIVLLSPIMIIVALLIRRDGGTAFYKQTRLTKNGKKFEVLKFRSMRMDAEKDGVARLSTGENDARITPIGKIIRSCRIDELPQLINIFQGTMSIVGPRPERPEIAAEYEKEMPEFSLRLQAKAGLTGLAQVYGKYNTTPYDKLLMDLEYIAKASIVEDLRIMFATVKILFLPESTEGVQTGATNALVSQNVTYNKKTETLQ